jgi:tRNA pseudouridine38-40 synthase
MRYLLEIAFKGTHYHGWQIQHNALSVQEVVNEKLSILAGENIETLGCGRTDTGVHATSYFVHFDVSKKLEEDKFIFKLNQILPLDIAAYSFQEVSPDFNARFDAISRTYEYHITHQPNPFITDTAWYQYGSLDIQAMNTAARLLIGKKDFECFSKVHTQVNNFICDVTEAYWTQDKQKVIFTITANRFLRNMVRAIVGTLVEVGRGKLQPDDVQRILDSKDRSSAGQSVPAHGLFLTKIIYP